MRKIALLLIMALAMAAAMTAPTVATAQTVPPVASMYCLNGTTTSLPATVTFQGGSRQLSEGTANAIAAAGGRFFLGTLTGGGTFFVWNVTDAEAKVIFVPGYSTNTVARGACVASMSFQPPRNYWLCYSRFQIDPAVYSETEALRLYNDGKGYWVPFAVKAAVSKTNIGNGVYLVCNLPTGYTLGPNAVSTGGGENFIGILYARVAKDDQMDYTPLAARTP